MKKQSFNDDLMGQVGFLIKRVQQAFRNQMDKTLKENGLSTAQYAVLAHLRRSAGLSNAELARRCFVTAPTMIRIIQDLETLKFIERAKNSNNRNVIDVVLTRKGQKTLESCDAKVFAIQNQMVVDLTSKEVAQLASLLAQCAQNLESL